ncbi:LIMR family protein [Gossypium australe]|uniref:LIMR family protein n=1 Tax=Gossypium australe TaxID=47621 RepID=A0A5B6W2V0_9ROSI|nr:LIMR family protein [Gossypium australe]
MKASTDWKEIQIRFYDYLAGLESKKFGNSELPTRISAWGNDKIKMLFSKARGFQATPKSKGKLVALTEDEPQQKPLEEYPKAKYLVEVKSSLNTVQRQMSTLLEGTSKVDVVFEALMTQVTAVKDLVR